MTPANSNTKITTPPEYIGFNWLGVHKVRTGKGVGHYWSKDEATEGVKRIEGMRKT